MNIPEDINREKVVLDQQTTNAVQKPRPALAQQTLAAKTKAVFDLSLFGNWKDYIQKKKSQGVTVTDFLHQGIPIKDLIEGGISVKELLQANVSEAEIIKSGVKAKDVKGIQASMASAIMNFFKALWKAVKGNVDQFLTKLNITSEKGTADFGKVNSCVEFFRTVTPSQSASHIEKMQVYFRNLIRNNSQFLETSPGTMDVEKLDNWLLLLVLDRDHPENELHEFLRICPPSISGVTIEQFKKMKALKNPTLMAQLMREMQKQLRVVLIEDVPDRNGITLSQLETESSTMKQENVKNDVALYTYLDHVNPKDFTFIKKGRDYINLSLKSFHNKNNLLNEGLQIAASSFEEGFTGSIKTAHQALMDLFNERKEVLQKQLDFLNRFQLQAIRCSQITDEATKEGLQRALDAVKQCYETAPGEVDFLRARSNFDMIDQALKRAEAIYDLSPEGLSAQE